MVPFAVDHRALSLIAAAHYILPNRETMKALHDLVEAGKIRYIGASSMWTWEFAQYQHIGDKHGWTKFIAMQNCYSLLVSESSI